MLSLNEALEIVKNTGPVRPVEMVNLVQSSQRVLAEDVFSDMDMPPFNKSAMDGYACRKADLQGKLTIAGTVYAGEKKELKVEPGTCIKITTGAPVPSGADTVIMLEDTEKTDENTIRCLKSGSKPNICYRGEDVKKDDRVLRKGTLLLPHHLATLASVGATKVKAYALPEIVLISTGSELVEPDSVPEGSRIRNSNAYNLLAQIGRMGISATYAGIVSDEPDILEKRIQKSLQVNDILILTGGASAGEHDYIPGILARSGMKLHFTKLGIQPGKPVSFASEKGKYCFGLSGNPVSSYLQFELLAKPLIYKLMGYNYEYPIVKASADEKITRKKAERLKFFPVKFTPDKKIIEIHFNGSAHIAGLTDADGFGLFPVEKYEIEKGEYIEVLLIK